MKKGSNSQTEKIELDIGGMTCDSCAVHVQHALESVEGVKSASVPHWSGAKASVTSDPDVDTEKLVAAVERAGYRAVPRSKPRDTTRPEAGSKTADYDLIVVGTGGGGMAAALKSKELGKKVLLVEAGIVGGTCVNIGCVPSKTLIRAAETYHRAKNHRFDGIDIQTNGVQWGDVVRQKDALVEELRHRKYENVLQANSERVTLVNGTATLVDGGVRVDDDRFYSASKIIIATGARPRIPSIEGIDGVNVLTSTTLMSLDKQPGSLVVIGGRAIALELGQALSRLGTKVTILQRSDRLIPDHDPEISRGIQDYLGREGLEIHTGVTPLSVREENGKKIVTVETKEGQRRDFEGDQILMATGRTPNTENLGLEEAGVKTNKGGFILVDESLRTTNPDIYAVGDVTTLPKLVYVAAKAGGLAAANALASQPEDLDVSVLPAVIFTDPQIATVGLTETEAREKGYEVRTTVLSLEHVPRALAARDTRGFIKLVADKVTDRLLGAHILAPEGGELVQTAALAVKFGSTYGFTLSDLSQMLFPYLTQVEGLKLAALSFDRDIEQLSCCAS